MESLLVMLICTCSLFGSSQEKHYLSSVESLKSERTILKKTISNQITMSLVAHTIGVIHYKHRDKFYHLPEIAQPMYIFNTVGVIFDVSLVKNIIKLSKVKKSIIEIK